MEVASSQPADQNIHVILAVADQGRMDPSHVNIYNECDILMRSPPCSQALFNILAGSGAHQIPHTWLWVLHPS